MKLTDDSINHNVFRLIENTADSCWDLVGDKDEYILSQMRMAYIDGVLSLASELKKVLKE